MAVTTTKTNKPINPRGNDQSPKGYNRAELYSGKALDFDGVNDSVSVADSNDLDGFTNFTYSVIAKADSTPNYCRLFDKGLDALLGAFNLSDQLYLYINSTAIQFDYVLKLNEYLHFTIVFTGGQDAKLYVNGVLEETQTHSIASVGTNSTNFAIGANNALTGNVWDGHMSNARLFNTALTAAQVSDLYNNPEKIVPTGVSNDALKLWLPMMEGAGTTAYDGSGNGNHGTISGATWTHGIGSPVAQTAVIDWNKGRNMTHYSEDGTQWTTGGNTPTITQDQADPFGGTRAQRVTMDASGTFAQVYKGHNQILSGVQYTAKMWLKAVSGTPTIGINYNGSGGTWHQVTLTNEWAEYEVTRTMNADYSSSHNIVIGSPAPGTSSTADFYVYGLQIQLGDTAGPYVPTFGTAQTSDVLLPQGLTSGRDITGVNLFENVRKQGALNLDGNSWAEVHDNSSLDITDEVTLEAWVYFDTLSSKGYISKWGANNTLRSYLLYQVDGNDAAFFLRLGTTNVSLQTGDALVEGWMHIVGTYDGANMKVYVNGSESSSVAATGSIATNTQTLEIGRFDSSSQLQNQIAQPRIYNRALTAEEVERNYNAGKNIYK